MKNLKSLQLSSTEELSNFLRRFAPISSSLLIEVEDGQLKAKTHTPERSVVKSSKIDMSRVFDMEDVSNDSVKFGKVISPIMVPKLCFVNGFTNKS